MTSRSVYVDICQTVDFNTEVDKVGVVGVHTPPASLVNNVAEGLMRNFKKISFESVDVVLACVSQLDVDPLGVGFEPGQIAPQDVINPVLFKAVTGDSLNTVLNTLYGTGSDVSNGTFSYSKVSGSVNAYYRMMNDPSFRSAHPLKGMVVRGLQPMVREVVTNRPMVNAQTGYDTVLEDGASGNLYYPFGAGATNVSGGVMSALDLTRGLQFMSGKLMHLPPQNTYAYPNFTETGTAAVNQFMKTYVGVFVLPPAIMKSLYFRLQLVWHVKFSEFRHAYDIYDNPTTSVGSSYFDYFDRPVDGASEASAQQFERLDTSVDVKGIDSLDTVSVTVV